MKVRHGHDRRFFLWFFFVILQFSILAAVVASSSLGGNNDEDSNQKVVDDDTSTETEIMSSSCCSSSFAIQQHHSKAEDENDTKLEEDAGTNNDPEDRYNNEVMDQAMKIWKSHLQQAYDEVSKLIQESSSSTSYSLDWKQQIEEEAKDDDENEDYIQLLKDVLPESAYSGFQELLNHPAPPSSTLGEDPFLHVDRHVKQIQSIPYDDDCMKREFNVKDSNLDMDDVRNVFLKCRLVILRNVHSPEQIERFTKKHSQYLQDLQQSALVQQRRRRRQNQKKKKNRKKHYTTDMDIPIEKETNNDDNQIVDDDIAISQRVIGGGGPSKRYEVLVSKDQYVPELAENPILLELFHHPLLLDEHYFIHSYGTTITEPQTAHQGWHEEDNYLYNSIDSFEYVGIGGHDLPPYTINMFTPLLNLTYDHGPTEFCMGTSHLTGLYSSFENDDDDDEPTSWKVTGPLHDPTLLSDGNDPSTQDFMELLQFGRNVLLSKENDEEEEPICPPQFFRSALLNVGDVAVFDYQIIHRGGMNLSNDTRAQLYIAYARSWFRDFNYHVNTHGHEKTSTSSSSITTHTRFVPPILKYDDNNKKEVVVKEPKQDITSYGMFSHAGGTLPNGTINRPNQEEDKQVHNKRVQAGTVQQQLQTLRNILPPKKPRTGGKRKVQEFTVTSIDLDDGTYITLNGTQLDDNDDDGFGHGIFHSQQDIYHIEVIAREQDVLTIHSPLGVPLKSFPVLSNMHQVVISKASLGVSSCSRANFAAPEVCHNGR